MTKYTIKFYIDKSAGELTPLILSISQSGKRLLMRVGKHFKLEPKYWNDDKQQAKKNYNPEFNADLERLKGFIHDYFRKNDIVDLKILKQEINYFLNPALKVNCESLTSLFAEYKQHHPKYSTKLFSDFILPFGTTDKINIDIIQSKFNALNLTNETQYNYYNIIIRFLNWIKKEKKINLDEQIQKIHNYRHSLKINRTKSYLMTLTEDEIDKLESLELNDTYNYYRSLFLLECYTGQRQSDILKLVKSGNIKYYDEPVNGMYGEIRLSSKKTNTFVLIPIHKRMLKHLDFISKPNKIRDYQTIHVMLKKLFLKAGFTDLVEVLHYKGNQAVIDLVPKYKILGTHTGRRTFVTLMLKRNVPMKAVMDVAGINNIQTIQHYQKFLKEDSAEAVAKAFM